MYREREGRAVAVRIEPRWPAWETFRQVRAGLTFLYRESKAGDEDKYLVNRACSRLTNRIAVPDLIVVVAAVPPS